MPFESLEQAYHLYNYKRKVFNQIAGAYGVPQLWHDYKRLRDTGSNAKDSAKQVHRYTIKKWQMILKRYSPEQIVWINNDELDITQLKEKLHVLKVGIGWPANRRHAIQEAEKELARRTRIEQDRFNNEVRRLYRTPNDSLTDEEILTKIKYLRRGYGDVYDRQKELDRALAYRKKQLAQRRKIKRKKEQSERKDRRSQRTIIDNYFEMYRNQGKGQPTLEDIRREEGRPLTVEEESSYYKKIKGEQ